MTAADPIFPPLLKGHGVAPGVCPMAAASQGAAGGRLGAGDLLWSRDEARAAFAIVLEPDVPLVKALHMVPLLMVAVGDCLGALAPPQVSVTFGWPSQIRVNGAEAGRVRAAADDGDPAEAPAWLVAGADIRISHSGADGEPGDNLERTCLAEEGCSDITRTGILESCSRHFLAWLNIWEDDGFRPVHDAWLSRAAGLHEAVAVPVGEEARSGVFTGLDEDGGLLLRLDDGRMVGVSLAAILEPPPH